MIPFVLRELSQIRTELETRAKWTLADENRDSKLIVMLLLQLLEHLEEHERLLLSIR